MLNFPIELIRCIRMIKLSNGIIPVAKLQINVLRDDRLRIPEQNLNGCRKWLEVIPGIDLIPRLAAVVIISSDLTEHLHEAIVNIIFDTTPLVFRNSQRKDCNFKGIS